MAVLRGKLVSWDSGTYVAVVRLDGAVAQTITGVAVNRAIEVADMNAGDVCLVDLGDHGDPADAIVTAIVTAIVA